MGVRLSFLRASIPGPGKDNHAEGLLVRFVQSFHPPAEALGKFNPCFLQTPVYVHPGIAFADERSDIHDDKQNLLTVPVDDVLVLGFLRPECSQLFAGSVKLQNDSLAFAADLTILRLFALFHSSKQIKG